MYWPEHSADEVVSVCNWEVSSWRKQLSVSPNNPTRGLAMKGDLEINDKCKRGIGVKEEGQRSQQED